MNVPAASMEEFRHFVRSLIAKHELLPEKLKYPKILSQRSLNCRPFDIGTNTLLTIALKARNGSKKRLNQHNQREACHTELIACKEVGPNINDDWHHTNEDLEVPLRK